MKKDGLGPEQAMFALSSRTAHVLGSVLVERMSEGPPSVPQQRLHIVSGMISRSPAEFPRLAERSRLPRQA